MQLKPQLLRQGQRTLTFNVRFVFYLSVLVTLLLLSMGVSTADDSPDRSSFLSDRPAWVEATSVDYSEPAPNSISDGTYFRLVEKQINLSGLDQPGSSSLLKQGNNVAQSSLHASKRPVTWKRYITELLNQTAVENESAIYIDFDPIYHSLQIHQLNVIRDGQSFDRRHTAAFQVLHREQDAESRLYDGFKTLNIILDDVRVGDSIELEYSIAGLNPAYDNNVEKSLYTSWSVPVQKYHYRILTDRTRPLDVRQYRQNAEIKTVESDSQIIYQISGDNTEPTQYGDQTPAWFNLDSYIVASDMSTWHDVVTWIEPAYRQPDATPESIREIARTIRQQHDTESAQIVAALQWVQSEIRYLGIELGAGSHIPSPAQETLQRRFGDCKDKTVLLLTLLKELGVDAEAALVHSKRGKSLNTMPARMHAFNHVIARVTSQGKSYWLDPTLTHQDGTLGSLYEPDYGYALVLSPDTTSLTDMVSDSIPIEQYNTRAIAKAITVTDTLEDPVNAYQQTKTTGSFADNSRYMADNESRRDIEERYARYYTKYYGPTLFTEPLTINALSENTVEIIEQYQHTDFWSRDDDDPDTPYTWLYANEVRDYLKKPTDLEGRQTPYRLSYPTRVTEYIAVTVPYEVPPYRDTYEKTTDYFTFTRILSTHPYKKEIRLDVEFRTLKDSVPANDIKAHYDAIEDVRKQTYILLGGAEYLGDTHATAEAAETPADPSEVPYYRLLLACFGIVLLGISLIVVSVVWNNASDSPFTQGIYHPVSIPKFVIMSLLTANVYGLIWVWRAFKFERTKRGKKILPLLRTIFLVVFFYSLTQYIRQYASEHPVKNVYSRLQAVMLAIAYFVVAIASGMDNTLSFVAIPFITLLLIPLVVQVNRINADQPDIIRQNSRISATSVGLVAVMVPLIIIVGLVV